MIASTACNVASCSGVVEISGNVGMMNGDESPCTGTVRARFNTSDSFCKSVTLKRTLMCSNNGGKVCINAVRNGWEGTYSDMESSGGFVE